MRQQDWSVVVRHHICEAGGDPRWVLRSADDELEKIGTLLGVLSRGGETAAREAGFAAKGLGMTLEDGARAGGKIWGAPGRLADRANAYAAHLGNIFERSAGKAPAAITPRPLPTYTGPSIKPGGLAPETFSAMSRPQQVAVQRAALAGHVADKAAAPAADAAAGAAKAAKKSKAADTSMFDGLQKWWGDAKTPSWQKYGLVAGGAAVPAIGAGLMMSGDNGGGTTIIQR